jgi:hypothetical protein
MDIECELTSKIGKRCVGRHILTTRRQRAPQPPMSASTRSVPEEVPPRIDCRQLLHAPLFASAILEPNLKQNQHNSIYFISLTKILTH